MSNKYDYLIKFVIIGDTNTGKSCLLQRFVDDTYTNDFISTIGIDFKVKTINIDDKIIKVQMWDTSGQCRFRSITNSYYRGAHGMIIAFDITNKKSFTNIERWMRDVKNFGSENSIKILIGTKSDLIEERQISKEEIDTLVDELGISYIETSAKENNNINELFVTICKEILINISDKINAVKEKRVFIDTHLLKKNRYNCCW